MGKKKKRKKKPAMIARVRKANKAGDYERAVDIVIEECGLTSETWPDFFCGFLHRG